MNEYFKEKRDNGWINSFNETCHTFVCIDKQEWKELSQLKESKKFAIPRWFDVKKFRYDKVENKERQKLQLIEKCRRKW